MKVRIGGQARQVNTPADLKAVEREIAGNMVRGVTAAALDVTPRFLQRLKERVEVAATMEANRIMSLMVSLIDKPRRRLQDQGLSAAELMVGMDLSTSARRSLTMSGSVRWQELNPKYSRSKDKRFPQHRNNMFKARGTMRNYFKGRGANIIRSRLGGIQVQVDRTLTDRSYPAGNNRWVTRAGDFLSTDAGDEVTKVALGRVTVTMFPRLSPSMAPMLSTRRWTDSGTGAMEEAVFGGTRTLDKLMNRYGSYRPLLTPVVQFFMLNRIPAAINRTLQDYIQRTSRIYD